MSLGTILAAAAGEHGERPALHVDDGVVTYDELLARSRFAEAVLRARGVARDDRVALLLPNEPGFVAMLFAIWRIGAIAVPLNPLLAPPEIADRVELAGVSLVVDESVVAGGLAQKTGEAIHRAAADPAVILFTSGTSGRPKGAVLTHGSIATAAGAAADAMAFGPEDVVLGAAPFSHVLGLVTGVLSTLLRGGSIAVERRFDGEGTLARMTATRTTILLGVPTMCIALCEAARSAPSLPPVRIAHVGGAAVPNQIADDFERTFGGRLVEGYGLTEMSGIATTYTVGDPRRSGSVGTPLGETELRIADPDETGVGEVEFRGPSVVAGYWNEPGATAAAISPDGWLATGDLGRLDADGYLYLVDRKKELVIRGGYNVYPREVEEALYSHPDVLDAAVVGVPHDQLGEEVAAVVVLRPGAAADAEELKAWTKQRVAAYKYPRIVTFADELPKGPTGKILKRAIDRGSLT